jgi:beta-galactosidase beta subunit
MAKQIINNDAIFTVYTESERQKYLGKNYASELMPKRYIDIKVIAIGKIYITVQYKIQGETQKSKIRKDDLLMYISDITLNKEYQNVIRKIVYYFRSI